MRQLLYKLGLVKYPESYKTMWKRAAGENAVLHSELQQALNIKLDLDVANSEIKKLRLENEKLFAGEKPKVVKITRTRKPAAKKTNNKKATTKTNK